MEQKTRNRIISIMLLAAMIALFFIWQQFGARPRFEAVNPAEQKKSGTLILDGLAVADRVADLGFILPGKIIEIKTEVGKHVKKGELLAIQESADLKAQLASSQSGASEAEANFDQAKKNLKIEKLKLKGLSGNNKKIQQTQISSAEDEVDAKRYALESSLNSVQSFKAQLAKTVLAAPFDGIVTRQDAEVGEIASASSLSFLTIQSDSKNLHLEARATELDITKIKTGDKAMVIFDGFGKDMFATATVSQIDPIASLNNEGFAYGIDLAFSENAVPITAGMHASIIFE